MRQYLDLMRRALDEGVQKADRTGTGTLSVFGHQMRFDLAEGFPLVTTKKLHVKSIIHELLWFLAGDTNIRYLKENGVSHLGRMGGRERRSRPGLRQAVAVLGRAGRARHRPDCRRRRGDQEEPGFAPADRLRLEPGRDREDGARALPLPFPVLRGGGKTLLPALPALGDIFLGVPFNIASYALLTLMMAQVTGLRPGEFVHTLGDAHLYLNHIEQAREQLTREPRKLPTMRLNPEVHRIFDFVYERL